MTKPTNNQIIKNLNLSGNFLESSVFSKLVNNRHFIATAEWPYTQPTFHGAADIVALYHAVDWNSEPLVFFAIECKKAKKDQKVWVFDSNRSPKDLMHPIITKSTTGQVQYRNRLGYHIPNLQALRAEDAPIFNKCYELREGDGNLNLNNSERIYTSLIQANQAVASIANTNHKKIFDIPEHAFEDHPIAIVPVVITNADLKTMSYNPDTIDPETGEIKTKDVDFQERDWLMFEFPLNDELQIPGSEYKGGDVKPIKRPTYIIRAPKVEEILQAIASALEY